MAAALGNEEEDHWEWHMFDTVKGSDYLADQDVAEILAREAPERIVELEHLGVPFSRNAAGLIEQRRFGGHTRNFGEAPVRRACYASDRTGRAVMDALRERPQQLEAVRAISAEITQELDIPSLLALVLRRAMELVPTDSGCIYLLDGESERLTPAAWDGYADPLKDFSPRGRRANGPGGTAATGTDSQ